MPHRLSAAGGSRKARAARPYQHAGWCEQIHPNPHATLRDNPLAVPDGPRLACVAVAADDGRDANPAGSDRKGRRGAARLELGGAALGGAIAGPGLARPSLPCSGACHSGDVPRRPARIATIPDPNDLVLSQVRLCSAGKRRFFLAAARPPTIMPAMEEELSSRQWIVRGGGPPVLEGCR
jgi:hypothetical protein